MSHASSLGDVRYLLKYSHPTRAWTRLYYEPLLKNYTMMQASPCGRVVVCGSIWGDLVVISPLGVFNPTKRRVHGGKVIEMHPLPGHGALSGILIVIFISSYVLTLACYLDVKIMWIVSHGINDDVVLSKFDASDPTEVARSF